MKNYDGITVYYFSGTGNSKLTAQWIQEQSEKYNIKCELINIAETDRLNITSPPKEHLLIFISPTHGFNFPPVMIYFINRFPKSNNFIALINTRAGMKLGKFITPGLTGIALYYSALVMLLKGYNIKGMFSVDLPSNWISVHPGLTENAAKFINEKVKIKTKEKIDKLLDSKKELSALKEIIQDIIISPISLAYFLFGRFFIAKTYVASKDCNNCGLCIKKCPVQAIKLVDNRPFWTFKCESCMRCMSYCPEKAIETTHGVAIGVMVLFYTIVVGAVYSGLSKISSVFLTPVMKFVVEWSVILLLYIPLYRTIHFLMRFKIVERLVIYTSLTKFKFWGRRYRAQVK